MHTSPSPSKLQSRYQIQSVVGQGGAGEVSTAWDTQLERTVAIKRLRPDGISEDVIQSTWQEAMRLASIRHANIVTIYDMGMDSGVPYIVMEYVNGETVDERVDHHGALNLRDFLSLAEQALEGLTAAHHAGLLHRDLKPSNVMLSLQPSKTFQVKLLDFGIARFLSSPTAETSDGTVTGSVHCVAPEILNRESVDIRSDLYSIGCVFYYALAGIFPFNGERISDVIAAHLSHRVADLRILRPDLPNKLTDWVMSLINRWPQNRYASAMQALAALHSAVDLRAEAPTTRIKLPVSVPANPESAPGPVPSSRPPAPMRRAGAPAEDEQQEASLLKVRPVYAGTEERVENVEIEMPVRRSLVLTHNIKIPDQKRPSWALVAVLVAVVGLGVAAGVRFLGTNAASTAQVAAASHEQSRAVAATAAPVSASTSAKAVEPAGHRANAARTDVEVQTAAPVSAPAPTGGSASASNPPAAETARTEPAVAAAPVVPAAEVVLRFHGSNTIGAELLPALLEKFLQKQGATETHRKFGKDHEEISIEARFPGEATPKAIEIAAHGSKTAFDDLAAGKCDVGVASRPIKPEEAEACARIGLGDLQSPACEHVLGLDGIAVLVHKSNPVDTLSVQQIGEIFTGKITDWSQVGGKAGPINLYARDAKSGTFDTFKALVLGSSQLAQGSKRFEDSNELSDAVSADPQGIGFAGLPFVRAAKLLAVSEAGAAPFVATRFTVATEDYALSRRLFLYTPVNPVHPWISRFVEFALGEDGQEVVSKIGFIKQSIDLQRPVTPSGAPVDYVRATSGADRLSLNLRFRKGSTELDNKSIRDIDRIAQLMTESRVGGKRLLLFGFADNSGTAASNVKISKERAQAIGKQLAMRGISPAVITGFGPALPVASNESEQGRERNRRVEVWIR